MQAVEKSCSGRPFRACLLSFFFNDTATTEIYTLSLHDALPIWIEPDSIVVTSLTGVSGAGRKLEMRDRKSIRLNSSHYNISYAVFCLKKKTPDRCDTRSLSFTAVFCASPTARVRR